ncbi:unnamed protein product [Adineta steineri]|uniref:Uncharacterized protein n=1 Tax=Adineta steineri TaxID=433720 RepID=A0A814KNX3_9BILA|nr:unnamed protein product [Adineta steineri]
MSALRESAPKAMLTKFNRHQEIPQAPPLPITFNEKLSSETLKSTDFSKEIKNHTTSITPSGEKNINITKTNFDNLLGTDLSQSMLIRPSQITEPPPIIQVAKSKTYSNPITKSNLRNRRRTPLTPDILALTKVRRPEHIKSSIAQRIEELKQSSLMNNQTSDEKSSLNTDLAITCDYKNTELERHWLTEQTQLNSPIQFINTNNSLQLNNRLFTIRSIEFLNNTNVRFYAQEKFSDEKYLKQISIITILILSILRLIENTLSNLSIPGVEILLNIIYVFIFLTIAIILLTNQK